MTNITTGKTGKFLRYIMREDSLGALILTGKIDGKETEEIKT